MPAAEFVSLRAWPHSSFDGCNLWWQQVVHPFLGPIPKWPPPENKRSFAPDRWDVGDMCACRGAAVVCDGYLVCR